MSQTRRNVLGRGLSALIPDAHEATPTDRQIQELPIDQIMAANTQRTQFDEARIAALADSLQTDGFINPLSCAVSGKQPLQSSLVSDDIGHLRRLN